MKRILERKIAEEKERHSKAIGELEKKLYWKTEEGHKIGIEIQLKSKYPQEQEQLDQVDGWVQVIQHEPKMDIKNLYVINGRYFDIHSSFGPFRDEDGEIIDKNNIDWEHAILVKKEYEVKKKNG